MKHETRNSVLGHTGPAGVHLSSWGGSELIFEVNPESWTV